MSNVLGYIRGSHNIRTGFDVRKLGTERGTFNERRGMFTFNGQMTGYAPADFMLGIPQRVTTPADRAINDIVGWRNGFFVNDTWQTTRNLTLNLGLRYELQRVPYTVNGNASMLNEECQVQGNVCVGRRRESLAPGGLGWRAPRTCRAR
jgi:outer membrane receptor protein involved in Fe transport